MATITSTLNVPGVDKSHPSSKAPKKTNLVLGNLPPKQAGFGSNAVSNFFYFPSYLYGYDVKVKAELFGSRAL